MCNETFTIPRSYRQKKYQYWRYSHLNIYSTLKKNPVATLHGLIFLISWSFLFQFCQAAQEAMIEHALADILYHVEHEGQFPEF